METTFNKTTKSDKFSIDPRSIVVVDGFNSRRIFDIDELAESIKENGVLNPITCIEFIDDDGNKRYRLVDGERRYRATMKAIEDGAEIARIPALLISAKTSEQDLLVQQLVRNDGVRFNEYEMAIACGKFIKWGWTQSEIARKLGKKPSQISIYLKHLERDERIQKMLQDGKITGAEVRTIYEHHKNPETGDVNEDDVYNEISLGLKKADLKGKKKVTLKDLSNHGKTKCGIDSKKIKQGLDTLIKYYKNYTSNGAYELTLDIVDILNQLNDGKLITDIFDEATKYREAE